MAPGTVNIRRTRFILVSLAALLLLPAFAVAEKDESRFSGRRGPIEADSIASSRVMVGYRSKPDSPSPTTAELWYTRDHGQSWHQCQPGETNLNPLPFDAPEDGLYGFYLILHGKGGASTQPPRPGFAPQKWVRVDRSTPLVQLLRLAPDERFELNRQVLIRWNVQDDNLPDRPTTLHYRTEEGRSYELIADTLPANSSYSWTVPDSVRGRVEIKVSAIDRAGNTGRYTADWLRVGDSTASVTKPSDGGERGALAAATGEPSSRSTAALRSDADADFSANQAAKRRSADPEAREASELVRAYEEPDAGPEGLPEGAMQEAQRKYDLGTWHRLRGEYAVAAARFREALKINPGLLAARNDLAGVLYLQGDHQGAESELRGVLAGEPRHQAALKTLALVQVTQRNYRSSSATLERLLLVDETDADAWLYLGDVRLFMGERAGARDAWSRAASIETAPAETRRRAEKRLDIYRVDGFAAGSAE